MEHLKIDYGKSVPVEVVLKKALLYSPEVSLSLLSRAIATAFGDEVKRGGYR